ncbi:serine hydrolase [Draconibacterium sp.]|nr:serine hydrolase [Draconibacterium sp.]
MVKKIFVKFSALSLFLISIVVLFGVSNTPATCQDYFPGKESEGGWRKNTSKEFIRSVGISPEKLEEFGQYNLSVPNSNWEPYSGYQGIIVIKDGWIIGEWYNVPEAKDFKTYLSSNGKAFAMMCFGIMADDSNKGLIPDTINSESKVYSKTWLPQGFPLSDPGKSEITFEHIFQHISGICPERSASGIEVEKGRNKWTNYEDWLIGHDDQWPQTKLLYFSPGHPEEYDGITTEGEHLQAYSSVSMGHLGLVLKGIYKKPAHQFLWERLLDPIGFGGIDFHAPPSDSIKWFCAGGLRMTPRDYARFACFLLHDGEWSNQQIVPGTWVQKFRTSPNYANIRSNIDGRFGENYPKDMFRIAGSGINLAFIIPSMNMIALRTGRANNNLWDEVEQQFLEKLFNAVQE